MICKKPNLSMTKTSSDNGWRYDKKMSGWIENDSLLVVDITNNIPDTGTSITSCRMCLFDPKLISYLSGKSPISLGFHSFHSGESPWVR